jgi:hypothetical protein
MAFFYHDFREDQRKNLRGLLSSVLFQLCGQFDLYCDTLSDFYLRQGSGAQRPDDDDLVRCFKDMLNLPGQVPVFLIIDALDECPSPHREEVLMLVEDLLKSQLKSLRICVTSCPEAGIKTVLEPLAFRPVSLHDEGGQIKDIVNYIRSVVYTNKKMQSWKPKYKELVIDILTKRADGV